jgi:hypothetical protein
MSTYASLTLLAIKLSTCFSQSTGSLLHTKEKARESSERIGQK